MSYTNKIAYPKDWEFSIEELSPISPEMIYRWFAYLAFGIENPSPDDNPTKGKCNSLLAYKKMLSFFMINRLPSWDELHRSGNPTKSSIVNDLIAFVKKKETRGQGTRSVQTVLLSTVNSNKFSIHSTIQKGPTSIASIATRR